MGHFLLLKASLAAFFTAVIFHWLPTKSSHMEGPTTISRCRRVLETNESSCSASCGVGKFSLPGMDECHELLGCDDEVLVLSLISTSTVKDVYLARWNGHAIVMSRLASPDYKEDFDENLSTLRLLAPNPYTVQFLGACRDSVYTEYHKLGNAANLNLHLSKSLKAHDSISVRFQLCIQYVRILDFLHAGPIGTRVMCDSNTLEKTLTQYLLTDDLSLVLNDLDAVPQVDKENGVGVICGWRPLHGSFVAPEQVWKGKGDFDPNMVEQYDEKIDIWRVPDVCHWFLGQSTDADILKFKLFKVHKLCKSLDPAERPTARYLVETYTDVKESLDL